MSLLKHSFKIKGLERDGRLDLVLLNELKKLYPLHQISRSYVRKLIIVGAVYLNRKRIRIASKPIYNGASLEVWIQENQFNTLTLEKREFVFTKDLILYEDDVFIAVDKPAGVPTQPTLDGSRANLYYSVKNFLKKRDCFMEPYLGLHHRLDRDTSGVILFTKKKEVNPFVSRLFAHREAKKIYQAITAVPQQQIQSEWVVECYLKKAKQGKRTVVSQVYSGGDYSFTSFKLLAKYPRGYWVEACPKTGRMHQVRVHLAQSQMPVMGDVLYGFKNQNDFWVVTRVMLHASSLTLIHPVTKNELRITSSLPEDFYQCLKEIQKDRG